MARDLARSRRPVCYDGARSRPGCLLRTRHPCPTRVICATSLSSPQCLRRPRYGGFHQIAVKLAAHCVSLVMQGAIRPTSQLVAIAIAARPCATQDRYVPATARVPTRDLLGVAAGANALPQACGEARCHWKRTPDSLIGSPTSRLARLDPRSVSKGRNATADSPGYGVPEAGGVGISRDSGVAFHNPARTCPASRATKGISGTE